MKVPVIWKHIIHTKLNVYISIKQYQSTKYKDMIEFFFHFTKYKM